MKSLSWVHCAVSFPWDVEFSRIGSPEKYHRRWGLKDDHPMLAPNHAAQRSELAKKVGLGRKPEPVAKLVKVPRKRTTEKPAA